MQWRPSDSLMRALHKQQQNLEQAQVVPKVIEQLHQQLFQMDAAIVKVQLEQKNQNENIAKILRILEASGSNNAL